MLSGQAPAGRASRHTSRALSRLATAVAAILAATAIAACGDDDAETSSADGTTDLTITLDRDGPGGKPAGEALVRCGDSDSIPSNAVCGLVDDLPADPAAPTPPDVACTEIYGGPDTARIEGTLEGEPMDAELTRANGCEIDRFDRWIPLLRELFPGYRPGAAIAP